VPPALRVDEHVVVLGLDPHNLRGVQHDGPVAIRGGCFCNPGAAERAFGFSPAAARACLRGGFSLTSFRACMGDRPVGALRASIGVPTTVADVDRLIEFVESLA